MRRIVGAAVGLGLIVAGGYGFYRYGLNDMARENLKKTARAVAKSYKQLSDVITAAQGMVMEDEGPLPNVQSTQQQWEALGF